jgi:predicted ATPase/signal transduction histidine kinase
MQAFPGHTVLALLHQGRSSVLYRLRRDVDGKSVIAKVPRAAFPSHRELARLHREFELAHALDVPGVVRPLDLLADGRNLALILEDTGGQSLRQQIPPAGMEVDAFLDYAVPLAEALDQVHQHRVIHLDVKPSNVIVDPATKAVYLTDFGIATRLSVEHQRVRPPDHLEGTLAYMSPEQTGRTGRGIDYRSDLYSLGVTFYEMLSGRLPFNASDPIEIVHAHLARTPLPLRTGDRPISRVLARIVDKLMAKAAEDRYQSAFTLARDLEAVREALRRGDPLDTFEPAVGDISPQFQIPRALYGRERERAQLQETLLETGTSSLVLVSGGAGIGKSALVQEAGGEVLRRGGWFLAGKFDQFQRNRPYSAFSGALRELIHQVLTESEAGVAAWRERLATALGKNGQLIVDVLPELGLIVGPQPPVEPVSAVEAQHRFNLTWLALIEAFAAARQPLVLFLDDLQWADAASLGLIERLVSEEAGPRLRLIGAYRDQEVDAAHPLAVLRDRLEALGRLVAIPLQPLRVEHLSVMLSETLSRPAEEVAPLADIVYEKTLGNPFFVHVFLEDLTRNGRLTFDHAARRWEWSIEGIRDLASTEHVVALMTEKIGRLQEATRRTLLWAACMGHTFGLDTLSTVLELTPADTVAALWEALEEGLVRPASGLGLELRSWVDAPDEVPEPPTCRFLHDRVQQAAYDLIPPDMRAGIHRKIGQLLLEAAESDEAALEERIFEIVNHLNAGMGPSVTPAERESLVVLNIRAGRKALSATAHQAAYDYARAGLALIGESDAPSGPLDLDLLHAEAAYLTGRNEEAESVADRALVLARDLRSRLAIYDLKIRLYTNRDNEQALRTGLDALGMLGWELPEHPKAIHIIREFGKARWMLRGKDQEELLRLPEMIDAEKQAVIDLFVRIASPAFLSRPELAVVLALKMFNLTMRYGHSRAAPMAFVIYGVANANTGNFAQGYRFGELSMRLLEQRPDARSLASLPMFLFAIALNHRRKHLREGLPYLEQAYQRSLESGDVINAEYALLYQMFFSLQLGDRLDDVERWRRRYSDFFRRTNGPNLMATVQGFSAAVQRQHVAALRGETNPLGSLNDADFSEAAVGAGLTEDLRRFYFHYYRILPLLLFGREVEALVACEEVSRVLAAANTISEARVPEFHFYHAMALASAWDAADDGRRRKPLVRRLARARAKLKKWAGNSPDNHGHTYALVLAEAARLGGRPAEAMSRYDEAIAGARRQGFRHHEALANERAAAFYRERGQDTVAAVYVMAARYAYEQWGATGKVQALERAYPDLAAPVAGAASTDFMSTTSRRVDTLDLTTVVKASQALSGEIVLHKLLTALMQIALENAGARRGALLLVSDDRLHLEAEGSVEGGLVVLHPRAIEEASDTLPLSVIHYVRRTSEEVVLDDAAHEGLFREDPYIRSHAVRSVLCIPLINQGQSIGILYLENDLTAGAFTPQRIELLQLLSAQMAISIENARLYSRLEQKVEERTEDLRRKNEALETTLQDLRTTQAQLIQAEKMASLGELTAGIAHEIKNPLNFINNFAGLNADLAKEMRDLLKADAAQATSETTAELIELLETVEVNSEKINEHGQRADRIVRSMMEHASSAAGAREEADLNRLLGEAVELAVHYVHTQWPGFGVTVSSLYDTELPTVPVSRREISRVFLNLLKNAFYAVHEKARAGEPSYVPTVKVQTERENGAAVMRIEDNGTGIPGEVRHRVFTPFFTTKPAGDGTGLGLSLSYDIVTKGHGGTIQIESEGGAFTRVIVRLPLA